MTTAPTPAQDCTTCRFVNKDKRPRIMEETGIDDQLKFDDAENDETIYRCRAFHNPLQYSSGYGAGSGEMQVSLCEHAGTERLVPITCSAWERAQNQNSERLAELDRLIAASEERARRQE